MLLHRSTGLWLRRPTHLGVGLLLSFLSLVSVQALAQDSQEPAAHAIGTLEPGFRTGVGLGLGQAGSAANGTSRSLGQLASYRVPLWIDLVYRRTASQTVGLYGQYGQGPVGNDCRGECNWAELRVGVQAQWSFGSAGSTQPWLGLGLGYQWLSYRSITGLDLAEFIDLSDLGLDADSADELNLSLQRTEDFHGPELVLQGGMDFPIDDGVSVGPFLSAAFSSYLSNTRSCAETSASDVLPADIACPAVVDNGAGIHAWLTIGLRGTYAP